VELRPVPEPGDLRGRRMSRLAGGDHSLKEDVS
jgi:hypothetical protein